MASSFSPDDFIRKWRTADLTERAGAQSHFLDLCRVLDEPGPAEADLVGLSYAFEKGAVKTSGRPGFADVWRKDRFAWEYKRPGSDLNAALSQLQQYALALDNPPILIACDLRTFLVQTNFTATVNVQHRFGIDDLRDPTVLAILKHAMAAPEKLRPGTTRQALTEAVAREFAELARRLRARGHDAQAVAHFTHRLVFCMFAEGAGLLPAKLFTRMLHAARERPADAAQLAAELFGAMALPGGRVGYDSVAWFNGGLFDDNAALPLTREDVDLCLKAAMLDWRAIDPSIFGTLFERGLDPAKEKLIGAHYTDRAKIDLIVEPVVLRPLRAEWEAVRAPAENDIAAADAALTSAREAAAAAMRAEGDTAAAEPMAAETTRARARGLLDDTPGARRTKSAARKSLAGANARVAEAVRARDAAMTRASEAQAAFLARLHAFRVLDPACGSGNFLYVALRGLKDLERRVAIDGETLGLNPIAPTLGPECVLGIEINRFAAELARMSVWIGEIQWMLANGFNVSERRPILRALDTIECRDALLDADGARAAWPKADAIVGNPPWLGTKKQLQELQPGEALKLRRAYRGLIPAASDLVCYWFEITRRQIVDGKAQRAGLVSTQNIKSGYSRAVLDRISSDLGIFDAWSNEPWIVEGAAVRCAIICFGQEEVATPALNGITVSRINSDLSSGETDLTRAKTLQTNLDVAFSGTVKGGAHDVSGSLARKWLAEPSNVNGRPNSDVLMPWTNTLDITSRTRGMWIIDFGNDRTEQAAAPYSSPFQYAISVIKPAKSMSTKYGKKWWLLSEYCPGMRNAISKLSRFIVTPTGSSHRVFVWLDSRVQPDHQLVAIARDDHTSFGILHSRFHEAWTRRLASSLGVGDDPRYNPRTTFETFPFPDGLGPDTPAAAYAGDPRAQAIAHAAAELDGLRRAWLNPPELVHAVPEVVPGFPDRLLPVSPEAAATLKTRTLTNLYNQRPRWLADAHDTLDRAVAGAYGWPVDIAIDDALARLLALNLARTG